MKKLCVFLLITFSLYSIEDIGEKCMQQETATSSMVVVPRIIHIGKIYRHYSGKLYKIIAIAHDSEDPSIMRVIYEGLYDCPTFGPNPVWDRPYTMFAEDVVINGVAQPRFALIESE